MERQELVAVLATLTADAALGVDLSALGKRVRELGRTMAGPAPASEPQAPLPLPSVATAAVGAMADAEKLRLVYDYWRVRTGHHGAKLLPERARHIMARLREGFSVVDLFNAIDGCALSEFHAGVNDRGEKYDWVENIMRNGSTVEKHCARFKESGSRVHSENAEVAKLREALGRAMEAGDVRSSNQLNKQLAAVLRVAAQGHAPAGNTRAG